MIKQLQKRSYIKRRRRKKKKWIYCFVFLFLSFVRYYFSPLSIGFLVDTPNTANKCLCLAFPHISRAFLSTACGVSYLLYTHSLTHSSSCPFTHWFSHIHTVTYIHFFTHSVALPTHWLSIRTFCSLTPSLPHMHSFTHSPKHYHWFVRSPIHAFIHK